MYVCVYVHGCVCKPPLRSDFITTITASQAVVKYVVITYKAAVSTFHTLPLREGIGNTLVELVVPGLQYIVTGKRQGMHNNQGMLGP